MRENRMLRNTETNPLNITVMITSDMKAAINEQINAELWSAYLYLSMSLDAESKALKGVANWFYIQWLEEQDHARIFQKYMNSQGAKVVLFPIENVPNEWKSVMEMFNDTLKHEMEVTSMIAGLMNMAVADNDYATQNRLQWFIDEQVEEEEQARDILENFQSVRDPLHHHQLDREMAKRRYVRSAPLGLDGLTD